MHHFQLCTYISKFYNNTHSTGLIDTLLLLLVCVSWTVTGLTKYTCNICCIYATVTQTTLQVTWQLHATKHHVIWISLILWSLEVNGLRNGSKKHSKAGYSEENAHDQVQPVWETKVITIGQWHVVSTGTVTGEYRNTCHVHQAYKQYIILHKQSHTHSDIWTVCIKQVYRRLYKSRCLSNPTMQ